jgi:uncharacterized protein
MTTQRGTRRQTIVVSMNDTLTFGAALLLGVAASGHCLAMCGGITTALGLATLGGRTRPLLLVGYQLGRIASYTLAGLLFAGAIGGVIALLDVEAVRRTLRILSALALVLAALVMFGRVRDPGNRMGGRLWRKLAPFGRRFLPVNSFTRAFAFGTIWGWMPCGFVYTVLTIATLQQSAARGAITMAAFGVGTAPSLLIASFGAQRVARFASSATTRRVAGSVLLIGALVTLAGPYLEHVH